ncbi:MAG TPA: Do family serine endopeptidase [Candidatus Acidoferrales bacterium]|jgi:serine protease Do|nr:Do family serine endopeptidase [Candidatus Acidoferrales bacterium]
MGIQIVELVDWVKRRKVFATLLVVLTLGIGIVIGTLISGRAMATKGQSGSGVALLAIPDPVQLSGTFAGIATRMGPAVVNISTTQVMEKPKSQRRSPHANDPMSDFFDHFFNSPDDDQGAERSLGSGVIVDKKGYILTNDHVIDQATKIQVTLDKDQRIYTAKLIGTDKETDLAVIKIDADRELPTARLGNSEGVQVGDWVLAFGSPFGLQATVTAGIVSAKDRSNITPRQFQRFLQTDAAINPGNSGGPLVNMAGEVIGINTAIYTGSRGFEGVGFAMPSNAAINVYNQLVTTGHVTRGSIGVSFHEDLSNNPVLLKELGVPYGIVIEGVEPGSPADKAGLKPGDVITEVNGHAVRAGADLVNPIAQTAIGQTVQVRIVRDKQEKEVALTVADRSKLFPQRAGQDEEEAAPGEAVPTQMGLRVEDLTPEIARRIGVGNVQGVVVTSVEPASFGEDIGFVRGDVIQEVNRVPVPSLADYRREIGKLKAGQDVLFKVARGGDGSRSLTLFLAGAVPQE